MIVGIDIDGTINDLHSVILEYGRLYNQTIINGTIKDENAYYIKDIFAWNVLDYHKFKWIVQSYLVNRIKSRNGVVKKSNLLFLFPSILPPLLYDRYG